MTTNNKMTITLSADGIESAQLKKDFRDFAAAAGFEGRYGGDVSAVVRSIASMPKPFRDAIALVIKNYNQAVDSQN